MKGMTLSVTSESLRQVNRNLGAKLERLRSWQNADIRSLRDLFGLRSDIVHVSNCLRSPHAGSDRNDPALNSEIKQYRMNLQQLAEILPVVHVRLQARRARLRVALDHLQAVTSWADASQRSL